MDISLGRRIRELRVKKGLSQVDLSKGVCTPSMISQIEADRARPSYKVLYKIADKFDVSLKQLLSDVDLNLEAVSSYKMARAMFAAKEYEAAIPMLRELLDHTSEGLFSKADILFHLATCYLHAGRLDQAEPLFSEAERDAMARQDVHTVLKVLHALVLIAYQRKNYQLAVYLGNKALDAMKKAGAEDVPVKREILYQIGKAHLKIGKIRDAIHFFTRSADESQGLGNLQDIASTYLELARSYKRINEFDKSVEYAERAEGLFYGIENEHLKYQIRMSSAVLLAETGQADEAMSILQETIAKYQELGKFEEVGIAHVEVAKILLQQGAWEQAEERCGMASGCLPEIHIYRAWIHRIVGSIAAERGDREQAIDRLEKAAECFKALGDLQEWEAVMFTLSELQLPDDCRIAYRLIRETRNFTMQTLAERGIVL